MMVFGKHPHERGEDAAKQQQKKVNQETPPRAWGRLTGGTFTDLSLGNTPTSVGKTTSRIRVDHQIQETPPRAWGRRDALSGEGRSKRNTPTSVGKTTSVTARLQLVEKHPHERGEDSINGKLVSDEQETPPRAWGRRDRSVSIAASPGNTPTSVGKT